MKRPEILSPAGNFEKMCAAIRYGADAVYLAGHIFGMRAAADNFSVEELIDAVKYAHERDVKVYLTLNTMPREDEYDLLRKYPNDLRGVGLDAMIIADVGVLCLVKEILPEMEIHIATQANATSAAACKAWYALGAKRVVLARRTTSPFSAVHLLRGPPLFAALMKSTNSSASGIPPRDGLGST
jgi:putative protease